MPERRVVIENGKTGEQYAVTPAAFRSHYEDKGFRILRWEGGEEYDGKPAGAAAADESDAARAKREARAARNRERRAARRAAAAAQPVGPQPQPDQD